MTGIAHADPIKDVIVTWATTGFANIDKSIRFPVTPPVSPEIRGQEADELETNEYGMDVPLITDVTQIIVRMYAGSSLSIGQTVDVRIDGTLVGSQGVFIAGGAAWYSRTFTGAWDRGQLQRGFNWVFTLGPLDKGESTAFSAVTMELTGRKLKPVN